ncbi:glycosyltransferase family 2 protein [Hazenella coriacea]|uniref:Glycosyl transferase family 2 n=1 Tax=Hazenella coriacea TaxID=1179467 RepID=A0A4R3L9S8_9BACL|nr:glycosyltransferase family 2 protein [Hazenella coriacea]TCS95890.1 glycosyl transferase family 2 [Hazenella coriacea]
MNNRGISIIIPCFQAGRYILDAVNSIRKQPFRCEYEYIVVDDGSNDEETNEALREIESSKDGKVIRLANNQGAQFARNEGLRVAKYDYILSIDADDCLNKDIMDGYILFCIYDL